MKKNQVLLSVALAAVFGIAGIYFQISKSAGWNDTKTDHRLLQDLPINDIAKIQIRSSAATVTLEKKQNKWGVAERNDYPADFDKIRDLGRTLWQLKPVQNMEIGPSQFERLKIAAPGRGNDPGVEIDLKGENDSSIASVILGKMMEPGEDAMRGAAGRFVYNPATKDRVSLVGETFANVDPVTVGSWLDKTFIAPGELREIEQSAWSNNQGWKIVRDAPKAEWKLQGTQNGETLEKQFAQAVGNFAPSFTDVRPASVSTDETGLNEPFRVQLKTFDGFKYDFAIGKPGPEKARYVKFEVGAEIDPTRVPGPNESPEDKKKKDQEFDKKIAALRQRLEDEKKLEQWVYLVPDWSLDQVMKRREEILAKPSPTPAPSPASSPSGSAVPASTPAFSPAPTPGVNAEKPASAPSPVSSPSGSAVPASTPTFSPAPTPGVNAEKPASAPSPASSPSESAVPVSTPAFSPAPTPSVS